MSIEHEIPLGNLRMIGGNGRRPYYSRAEDGFDPPEASKIFPSTKPGNPSRKNGASPNAERSLLRSSPSAARAVLDSRAAFAASAATATLTPRTTRFTNGTALPATLRDR